jgi:hypothetical protein
MEGANSVTEMERVRDSENHLAAAASATIREIATLPAVEAGDGSELLLSLLRADGSRVSVVLGAAEAVAVASDLLLAARVRFGRANWPPKRPNEVTSRVSPSSCNWEAKRGEQL